MKGPECVNPEELVKIEKVKSVEISELLEFAKRTFLETYATVNSESDMRKYVSENFSRSRFNEEFYSQGSEFFSAKIDSRWVGYLKVNRGNTQTEQPLQNSLEIERIYVIANFHGQGIAQKLYSKAVSLARSYQSEYLWLGVWEENLKAIKFYQKCGFELFGQHKFRLGDAIQNDLIMSLKIGQLS